MMRRDRGCSCLAALARVMLLLTVTPLMARTQDTLSFARFAAQVEANHPVSVQAGLVRAQTRSALQEAWGAFDPKFSLSVSQKAYKGEPYYTYLESALKLPTPFGADLKLGFDRTSGPKASDDRSTPRTGLLSLGMTVPLGQRIITDERRTALSIARAQRDIGDAEQQAMINKLLLDAAKAYGAWYAASQRVEIAANGERLARFRFDAVVARVSNGESAPVDTLEASIEVQRRVVTRVEAETDLRAARLIAASFLWSARGEAIELEEGARPSLDGLERTPLDTVRLAGWIAAMSARHPELRKAEAKLRQAQAERLFARQALIPFAEASLSSIGERDQLGALVNSDRWSENYKAGLEVESSVLLLKERGKAARTTQKEEYARLDRDRLRRDLAYNVRIALNDVVLLERVLGLQRATVQATTRLRDAEQARFLNGESTLLIVNLRERSVLDEATKLAAVEGKLAAARAALVVAVGDASLVP